MTMYATLQGNIGNVDELKTVGQGKQVLNFSVASNNPRKKEAPPTWVRCAVWGERAAKIAPYLAKGKPVMCIGPLTAREHEGKTYLELDVQEVKWFDGKPAEKHDADPLPF